MLRVLLNGQEDYRYYANIVEEDLVEIDVDDDGDWIIVEDGFAKGIEIEGKLIVDHEGCCQGFDIIPYEEISREYDFYGTGLDKIKAIVDGEEMELECSRWQGHTSYMIEHKEEE